LNEFVDPPIARNLIDIEWHGCIQGCAAKHRRIERFKAVFAYPGCNFTADAAREDWCKTTLTGTINQRSDRVIVKGQECSVEELE
jgi:hypothetical protein